MAENTKSIDAIRTRAGAFPNVVSGLSCNQTAFKVGKKAFLYIGPGKKGVGYKAMFKLDQSLPQAIELSEKSPDAFEVGKAGWVTARFTEERPLAEDLWTSWLNESYALAGGR